MKMLEFTDLSAVTAIYPNRGAFGGLTYVTYGLCGEIGEVLEILKKVIRDDNGLFTPEKIQRVKSEVGDVLWYWSQMIFESNTNLNIEMDADEVQNGIYEIFMTDRPQPLLTDPDLVDVVGRLFSNCYQYGGDILRSLHSISIEQKIEEELPKISGLNTEIFKVTCVFLALLGIKVSEVMQMNLDKLSARKDAGKIKGSGETLDER